MGITKILLPVALVAAIESTSEATTLGHDALRHRQLRCISRGNAGCEDASDCCGKLGCGFIDPATGAGMCCIPAGVQGCSDVDDNLCCDDLQCNTVVGMCVDDDVNLDEYGRPCFIHGEECIVTGADSSINDCCGDVKYLCEVAGVKDDTGNNVETCCMEDWAKGCSYDEHCCNFFPEGTTYCDPLLSQCMVEGEDPPDDTTGTPDCSNKGGECSLVVEPLFPCCGAEPPDEAARLDCQNSVCCLLTGINGCEQDTDCCDEHCDLVTSTCCIDLLGACEEHLQCCSGSCGTDGVCHSYPP